MLYPHAPEPWIDLSTGINPHSYPHSPMPASAFARLPEPSALETLKEIAAKAFSAPSAAHIAAAPGTQMLMPLLAQIAWCRGARHATVLSPAYAEHARTATMAGLIVSEIDDLSSLDTADYAVIINPNNPDGRLVARSHLLALAERMRAKGGMLVIDEAFIETGVANSLADATGMQGLVVLRSFGKFYGMAGVRLGFCIAHPEIAADVEARLGPWAVSGPALHVATEALADMPWQNEMRIRLRDDAARLDEVLAGAALRIVGGTPLFRLVQDPKAAQIADHLAGQGILVRIFDERPDDIRFGLPGNAVEWDRLRAALAGLQSERKRHLPPAPHASKV